MLTKEQLQSYTKDALLQFVESFFENNGRKYEMVGSMYKWHRTEYVPAAKKKKAVLIDWVLEYQKEHPDDPVEIKEIPTEERSLWRKTCKELKQICENKGFYFYGLAYQPKFVYIDALMGRENRSVLFEQHSQWLKGRE